jgi:hypothetical protein
MKGNKLFGIPSGNSHKFQLGCAQIGLKYLKLITLNCEKSAKSLRIFSNNNFVVP